MPGGAVIDPRVTGPYVVLGDDASGHTPPWVRGEYPDEASAVAACDEADGQVVAVIRRTTRVEEAAEAIVSLRLAEVGAPPGMTAGATLMWLLDQLATHQRAVEGMCKELGLRRK
jgi:hypothetical protein